MALHLAEVFCYPVKSMGEMTLQQAEIDRFGIKNDRRWMLVDDNGKFITQRQWAKMVHFKVQLKEDVLTLSYLKQQISVLLRDFTDSMDSPVIVWRDQCQAWCAPDEVNQWLSSIREKPCRLVYMPESTQRLVDPDYNSQLATVSFADGFPLLLTSESSLQDFNQHLSLPIEMLRFRPNLVVRGSEPWQEDQWRVVKIGAVTFDVVKPCSRCAIPTINRNTAKKEPEVFQTLIKYRKRGNDVYFGQNLIPRQTGMILVGDDIELLE